MKILLKFVIGGKEYGILKKDENDANKYINDLTRMLKNKHLLVSMKHENSGTYHYALINGDILATKQPVGESAKYCLTAHTKDSQQAKRYVSSNFDTLKKQVHKTLDSLECGSEPIDDICGQWSAANKDRDIKFQIEINDDGGHTVSYFDPLSATKIDSGTTLLQRLSTSTDKTVKLDLLIKYPGLHTIASAVAVIFSIVLLISSLLDYNGAYGFLYTALAIVIIIVIFITKLIYRSYETNNFCKALFRIPTNTIIVITIVACIAQLCEWNMEASSALRYNWASIIISSIMSIGFMHVLYSIATSDYKSLKESRTSAKE